MIAARIPVGGANDKFNLVEAVKVCSGPKFVINPERHTMEKDKLKGLKLIDIGRHSALVEFKINGQSGHFRVKSILVNQTR